MKSFRIFVFAMLLMPLASMATTNFVWTRGLGGNCMAVDATGNVIVGGAFSGAVTIGTNTLQATPSPVGWADIFLAKYDPAGNVLWARQAGGTNSETIFTVAVDQVGNIYAAGYFTWKSTVFDGITLTNQGSTNLFLAKYNADGDLLWVKTPTEGNAFAMAKGSGLGVDPNGNVYLTGTFSGSIAFDGLSITSNVPSVLVAKFDPNGAAIWVRNGGQADGNAIASDLAGNAIVVGTCSFTVTLGGTLQPQIGGSDVFVMKYDGQGNVLWVRRGGGVNNDFGRGIGVDQAGSIYVSGTFENFADFGDQSLADFNQIYKPVSGGVTEGPLPTGDVFVVKYDSNGRALWAQRYGGPYTDTGGAIYVDGAGNSHITGGIRAVFIASLDSSGIFTSEKTVATNISNMGQAIVGDGFGNVYVMGWLAPNTNYVFGSDVLTNAGSFLAKLTAFVPTNAPVLTSDLTNQTLIVTSNYIFSVGVTSVSPLTYQWQLNGEDIQQATNSFLDLSNVNFETAGLYRVIVSNAFGAVTSKVAKVQIEFPQEFVWVRQAGGVRLDEARRIAVGASGNTYAAGKFQFKATFGSFNVTTYDTTSGVAVDAFLGKYDPAGNVLWARQTGGPGVDEVSGLGTDSDENIYITGYFAGTAKFGGFTLTNTNATSFSGYLAKYDSDGNAIWAREIPITSNILFKGVRPFGLAVDKTNGVYITGRLAGTAAFGSFTVSSQGAQDLFLAKTDGGGNFEWVQTAGSTNASYTAICDGLDLTVDSSNNVLVAGIFSEAAKFGTNVLSRAYFSEPATNKYGFVAKYSPAGDVIWANRVLTSHSSALGVAADEENNVFVTGWYGTRSSSRASVAGVLLPDSGPTNLFLIKYDALGSPLWGEGVGGTNGLTICTGTGLAADGNGNVYVTGTNSGGTRFPGGTAVKPGGFIAKYGTGGNFLWGRSAGKEANSVARGGPNAYVTGSFVSSENFGVTNMFGGSSNDVFVAKLGIIPPKISVQLTNQMVVLGSNTTLRVTTTGTGPLNYQWQLNGVAIAGATGSALTLTNLHAANAGAYSVVVSNPSGTVTNLATVTVVPVVNAPRLDGTNLVISWEDSFTLQVSTNGVAGPYYDVPWATSPLTNSLEASEQFYRLRQ